MGRRLAPAPALALALALVGLAHAWHGPSVALPRRTQARPRLPTMLSYDSEQPAPSDVDHSMVDTTEPRPATRAVADMDAFIMLEGPPSFFWPNGQPAPASTKPVLVYLPGIEFTGYTISSQLERLEPLYDVRIFRVSPIDRTPAAELGAWIDAEVDALCAHGRQVVLMGESFGGVLALDFALRAAAAGTQERVKHMVLMNPATCIGATPWNTLVPAMEGLPAEVFGLVPLALSPLLANPLRLIDFTAGKAPEPGPEAEAAVAAEAGTRDSGPFPELLKAVEGLAARGLTAVGRLSGPVSDPGEAGWAEPEVVLERLMALLPVLGQLPNALPQATLAFRARELHSFARDVNGRDWSSVRLPTLVISSSNDFIIPSAAAARQIQRRLLGTRVVTLDGAGHAPLIEADVDLPAILASAGVLTSPRPRPRDYVADSKLADAAQQRDVSLRVMQPIRRLVSPRFFSTTASGLRLPGVGAVPSQTDGATGERRPILFVGNHQQIGVLDIPLVVEELLLKRGILARALAHPIAFASQSGAPGDEVSEQQLQMANRMLGESELAGVSGPGASFSKLAVPTGAGRSATARAGGGMFGDSLDISEFGAVPVSGRNLFRLLQRKEAVLLYPGGIREAFKARGEKYKLFWPEGDDEADFMRLAAKLNAIVVPIAAVGADDVFHLVDPEQTLAIPGMKESMARMAEGMPQGRAGEQFVSPVILPRLPLPRYYFLFGKPIDARLIDSADKRATADAYAQVQTELEAGMDWLLEKRRHDPYRNFVKRVAYEAASNWERQAPTFSL